MEPLAVVRIRLDDLPLAWMLAVADLLAAIDAADAIMVEGPVRDAADNVRRVLWGPGS